MTPPDILFHGEQTMPKQRPIEERIDELENRLRLLKQMKRISMEQSKLDAMKPKRSGGRASRLK